MNENNHDNNRNNGQKSSMETEPRESNIKSKSQEYSVESKLQESSTESKFPTNEVGLNTDDRAGIQSLREADAVLSAHKTDSQDKETVIDIGNFSKDIVTDVEHVVKKDFFVNEHDTQLKQTLCSETISVMSEVQNIKEEVQVGLHPYQNIEPGSQIDEIQYKYMKNMHQLKGFPFQNMQVMMQQGNPYQYPNQYQNQYMQPPPRQGSQDTIEYQMDPVEARKKRSRFLKIVFSILLVMFLATALIVGTVLFVDGLRLFFRQMGLFLVIPALIIFIGLTYVITMSECAKIFPCNLICLLVVVLCMSIMCSYVTASRRNSIVLLALISTAVIVMICIGLAFTPLDFTKWYLYLVLISFALGIIGLVVVIYMRVSGTYLPILHLCILVVATLVQVVILAAEIQMVIGGKSIEFQNDEYILAAFALYTSIIDIFIKLVMILGIIDHL